VQDVFVPDVNVIAAAARKDDLEVLECEVILEKLEQSKQGVLTLREHLGVRVLAERDARQVVGVEVEDEIRRLPVFLAHRTRAGIPKSPRGEIHVSRALSDEKLRQIAQLEERTVADHRRVGAVCPGDEPHSRSLAAGGGVISVRR